MIKLNCENMKIFITIGEHTIVIQIQRSRMTGSQDQSQNSVFRNTKEVRLSKNHVKRK